jgi:hypothetical protein
MTEHHPSLVFLSRFWKSTPTAKTELMRLVTDQRPFAIQPSGLGDLVGPTLVVPPINRRFAFLSNKCYNMVNINTWLILLSRIRSKKCRLLRIS